jgi:hypothetical protein
MARVYTMKKPRQYNGPTWFEASELPALGWIQITSIGGENFYFTYADGLKGFVKIQG